MSWALRGVRSSTMAALTRVGGGMPMWELRHAPTPPRLADAVAGGRCFVFLDGKPLRNVVLQGLRTSRQLITVATPPETKPAAFPNESTEYKKKRIQAGATTAADVSTGAQSVVVVESPSKAKTITKYLGSGYAVLPSYGHVRDLAARAGSVRPDDDFNMLWEVPSSARPHINSIKAALKGAQVLVLASDPDREGEAIAWHVLEMLTMEGALRKDVQVKRVVFHEITKTAVTKAMHSARDVSETLVNAYLARRALDYLIGFSLSPVLWRKLPGSKSAGRVQSAALRLVCDRELETEAFRSRQFWTVEAQLLLGKSQQLLGNAQLLGKEQVREVQVREVQVRGEDGDVSGIGAIGARLTHLHGEKLHQFSISDEQHAGVASTSVLEATLRVGAVKHKLVRRNPLAPYITSTLQQDASAKLGFGATRTMSIAQQLYEGVKLNSDEQTGLITYMRTDGVQISADALESIRLLAGTRYGENYVPAERRVFPSKVKNAQEAHEAIRPTDISRLPSSVAKVLEEDALQLYTLIWARTMACQMEPSVSNQVSVDVVDDRKNVQLRASSSALSFPGFLSVYKDTAALGKFAEQLRDDDSNEPLADLDQLKAGDLLLLSEVKPIQHFTEPPPRYSEGTLVKHMEELGIGRPSTYAPTLRTLQTRNYVRIEKRRIIPEFRGRMVSAFLMYYFPDFADFAFTANMERQLDEVSAGQANWKKVLGSFWPEFHGSVSDVMKVPVTKVVDMLEEKLADQLFPSTSTGSGDRVCPSCKEGKVSLKLSWFGAGYFFGCSRYPSCHFKANVASGEEEESSMDEDSETPGSQWSAIARPPKVLGVDPTTQLQVVMRVGPYGAYVQLGEASKKQKPRRTTLPKGVKAEEVTFEKALELLSFPRELGKHPLEGSPITISIGKFGFFLRHRAISASVPQGLTVEELTMDKAMEILNGKHVSRRGRRPRKVTTTQETKSGESSNNETENPSSSENSSLTSASLSSQEEQSSEVPAEKPKRKYVRKSKKNSETVSKDEREVSLLSGDHGADPVVKKRGRGRPRKTVEMPPQLLLAQE